MAIAPEAKDTRAPRGETFVGRFKLYWMCGRKMQHVDAPLPQAVNRDNLERRETGIPDDHSEQAARKEVCVRSALCCLRPRGATK